MALTKEDILKTAFEVWGAHLYQNTSLSLLARTLGITKPALYRHFRNKKLLLEAMADSVFEKMCLSVKNSRCLEAEGGKLRLIRLIRALAFYFENSRDDFIWTMMYMHGSRDAAFNIREQLKRRGIDLSLLNTGDAPYPTEVHFAFATMFFMLAWPSGSSFLNYGLQDSVPQIEARILRGLGFPGERINGLNYARLEKTAFEATLSFNSQEEHNRLLNAVASAMAEAGPYNVSLDHIAGKSGLAKSSLYNYFESKAEMMRALILKEFGRIARHGQSCSEFSGDELEKLYLSMTGIAFYLMMKPDILLIVDKLKTRKPEWLKKECSDMKDCIKDIDFLNGFPQIEGGGCLSGADVYEWILFLIVDLLQRRPEALSYADISNESFRILFGFIVKGIGSDES